MITPTVGRVVWFHPNVDLNDPEATRSFLSHHPSFALAETCEGRIAAVNEDGTVNLAVLDRTGVSHPMQDVLLVQEDQDTQEGTPFCEWMPYQKGQAAKNDTTVSDLESAVTGLQLQIESLTEKFAELEERLNSTPPPAEATGSAPDESELTDESESSGSPRGGRRNRK